MDQKQYEEFQKMALTVQGTKVKLVTAKKMFAVPGLGVDDMFAIADMAIFEAFKTWNPEKSKFNTHAHNTINFKLMDALNDMNPVWKATENTTYELSREGETYKTLKAAGQTQDDEFNKINGLDGSIEAQKRFNQELWKDYVQYQRHKRNPMTMINESQFKSGEDSEEFNIFDTVFIDDLMTDREQMLLDIEKLPADKNMIAQMILDGKEIGDIAKKMKMTKVQLLQTYAPKPKQFA